MTIQLSVREEAERQGLTPRKLAKLAGVSRTAILRYWHQSKSGLQKDAGTLQGLNLQKLAQVAQALNVNVEDLYHIEED